MFERHELMIMRVCSMFCQGIYDFIDDQQQVSVFQDTEMPEFFSDHQNGNIPYVIVRMGCHKTLFIVFRGTHDLRDVFSDMTAWTTQTQLGLMHQGLANIATAFYNTVETPILSYVDQYPDHSLVFTGHSLGGGVAAAAAGMFRAKYPKLPLRAITFGAMAGFDRDSAISSREYCATVVMKGDMVPFLALSKLNPLISRLTFSPEESAFIDLFPPGECFLLEAHDEAGAGEVDRTVTIRKVDSCEYFGEWRASLPLSAAQHSSDWYAECVNRLETQHWRESGISSCRGFLRSTGHLDSGVFHTEKS
jgi:hypothetical protein